MATVKITEGFKQDLAAVEGYWSDAGAPQAFDSLVDEILDKVIPNLERFPDMGRSLLDIPGGSVEALERIDALTRKAGNIVLRQYVTADYLILYSVSADIHLLAIRHHRQLSFDLDAIWLGWSGGR